MKMFLSSYRFGDHADELLELVGEDAEVAVITNAKDEKPGPERVESVRELFESFKEIGIKPHEIDLRDYFQDKTGLEDTLAKHGFVWLAGGNTFILRKALKYSGADKLLVKLLYDDKIIYAGESAGAVIAAPSLQGVEFGDDPYVVPHMYTDEEIWDGLHLVPYSIVPHYESFWEGQDRMIEIFEEENIPYKTLNDSQVIIVDDSEERVL